MFWSARPFVRIFLFLAVGIFIAFKFTVLREADIFIWYGIILLLLLIGYMLLHKRLSYAMHGIKGVVFGLIIVLVGILITTLFLPENKEHNKILKGTFVGIVVSQPAETNRVYKVVVKIENQPDSAEVLVANRKAMLYFEKDTLNRLHYGDVIIFSTVLKPPLEPANPNEFNYKSFLKSKGIELVGYVSIRNFKVVDSKPPSILKFYAIGFRNKLLKALKENGLTGKQYAVAAAIVLGYDDLIDDEIRQNYQRAGAMHVLCVSGLHVGVIYLVMALFLRFLDKNRRQKIAKVIILLLSVWLYALLTGLAPSVLRATVMMSFLIVGNEVERDKDAYNTLAMSAILLLIFNPGFLFDVGFQLSYAAVLGIVTFYRPIYRLIFIRNMLIDIVWSATAISIAAQLGAFPIAAHYFHFFPTWFLLSNLVIMVFSTFVISVGMLFILFSWVPLLSGWIAYLLSGLIFLMNYLINHISTLPFSGINDIYFPWILVVIVVLILFAGFRFVIQKEPLFITPLLLMILLFVGFQVVHRYNNLSQSKIVVFNTGKGHIAIDFISGNDHLLLCDSLLKDNPKRIDYFADEFRISSGLIKNIDVIGSDIDNSNINLWYSKGIIVYKGMRIAIVDDNNFFPLKKPLKVDWVWLAGKANLDVGKLQKIFTFEQLIIGQSVYHNNAVKISEYFSESGMTVYDLNRQGALVYNLNSE